MKLTEKDKQFLETLKRLMESRELWVELRAGRPSYLVLRGTYGDKIHNAFGMSRQGVRWRFQRLVGDVYVSAFESILFIEKTLGPQLRDHAVRISQERHELRQRLRESGFQSADSLAHRREPTEKPPV
jgi:hypothetical protein